MAAAFLTIGQVTPASVVKSTLRFPVPGGSAALGMIGGH
jgi:hypothetical protein